MMSKSLCNHSLYISAAAAGGCCKSQSITTQQAPFAWARPAEMALSLPKLRLSLIPFTNSFSFVQAHMAFQVWSEEPSSTKMISNGIDAPSIMPDTASIVFCSSFSSLYAGMMMDSMFFTNEPPLGCGLENKLYDSWLY